MDENVTTIHITKALSSSMIVELIDKYPNLEEITCSPSVYKRTSKTYIDALGQLDIEVKRKYNWGAKSKSNDIEFYIQKLSNEGLTARQISQKLDISLNRVYYLLRKSKTDFDNRKRKHNHEEIKHLKDEGLSIKEISDKLDISSRTVYTILEDKTEAKLPLGAAEGILRNAGAERVSQDAKILLCNALEEMGNEISKKAIGIARQSGRKTVKAEDIKLAIN